MLSAEALGRNEGMRKEKGYGAWKNYCVLHLRKRLESWGLVGSCQHPSSKPGAGGRADLNGWRSPGQAASQCGAHKAQIFPPAPRACEPDVAAQNSELHLRILHGDVTAGGENTGGSVPARPRVGCPTLPPPRGRVLLPQPKLMTPARPRDGASLARRDPLT